MVGMEKRLEFKWYGRRCVGDVQVSLQGVFGKGDDVVKMEGFVVDSSDARDWVEGCTTQCQGEEGP